MEYLQPVLTAVCPWCRPAVRPVLRKQTAAEDGDEEQPSMDVLEERRQENIRALLSNR